MHPWLAHLRVDVDSWELHSWSFLHNLQAALLIRVLSPHYVEGYVGADIAFWMSVVNQKGQKHPEPYFIYFLSLINLLPPSRKEGFN